MAGRIWTVRAWLRQSRMQPANASARLSRRFAARSSTRPLSDEIDPPVKSGVTLLRQTAGRSIGRRLSSVMVSVALSWSRQKCAGQGMSKRFQRRTPRSLPNHHPVSRVGGWRASFRVRWFVRRFRAGPQSGSRGRVSRPPLTEPGVPISGTGLSSGIMRLAHGPPGQGRDRAGEPADRGRCTTAILPPASSPMRRRACSRLDDIKPIAFDSFASACDALRTLGHQGGVLGRATPAGFRPSRIPPHLRPLPSAGITRHPRYCGPLRHPAGPACRSRGPGWRVPATDRCRNGAWCSPASSELVAMSAIRVPLPLHA